MPLTVSVPGMGMTDPLWRRTVDKSAHGFAHLHCLIKSSLLLVALETSSNSKDSRWILSQAISVRSGVEERMAGLVTGAAVFLANLYLFQTPWKIPMCQSLPIKKLVVFRSSGLQFLQPHGAISLLEGSWMRKTLD